MLCTFWLAQARALAGHVDQATNLFERAIAFVNDVDLLAEEVDPRTGELLGYFPQAFSHIGLVNAAWAIRHAMTSASWSRRAPSCSRQERDDVSGQPGDLGLGLIEVGHDDHGPLAGVMERASAAAQSSGAPTAAA